MRPITLMLVLFDERAPGEPVEALARLADCAWGPVLDALSVSPHVRLGVRLSGITLEWMLANRPHLVGKLADLSHRKQIEIIGGPHFNVPLHLVPWRDAHAQLQLGARWARVNLGARPRGGWIPQGAWDPQLPQLLSLAGLGFTFLDRGLVAAGSGGGDLSGGWLATERHGHSLGVFPLDRRMGSLLPWGSHPQVLQELRERVRGGERHVTVALPVEHFGYGARSSRWCWEGQRPWVPEFFELLSTHSAWLKTALPGSVFDAQPPSGQVYPVAGTSPDVAEDILPVDVAVAFAALQRAMTEGRAWSLGAAAPLLNGPPWETVLARYDESNRLHKRMLRASNAYHRLRRVAREEDPTGALAPLVERAQAHLFEGQSGGALHMGFNGGLADGAVRQSAWRSLLEVERVVAVAMGEHDQTRHEVSDYDGNGRKELLVRNRRYAAVLRPDVGGSISELHLWEQGNLVNTLTRRPERWLDGLDRATSLPSLVEEDLGAGASVELELEDDEDDTDYPTDPGFAAGLPGPPARHLDLGDVSSLLWTDHHRRGLFLDHLLGSAVSLENLRRGQAPEEGDFLDGGYQLLSVEREDDDDVVAIVSREGTWRVGESLGLLRLAKRYRFCADSSSIVADYELRNRIHRPIQTSLGVEFTLNLDSLLGPGRHLEVDQGPPRRLEDAFDEGDVSRVSLVMKDLGLRVSITGDRPARVLSYPVFTPLRGRTAYIRAFQGTCLVWVWPVSLWGQEKVDYQLRLSVEAL